MEVFIMSLFNRKNKEEKTLACACNAGCPTSEVTETKLEKECCGKTVDGICCIKVLGSGCKSCHALLEAAQEAVHSMGLTIEVEYITDMEKIMQYGVMSMPALVVNEQVASMGKVLKAKEVETLLKKLI
jgi:small redox-active disulfide protein 2